MASSQQGQNTILDTTPPTSPNPQQNQSDQSKADDKIEIILATSEKPNNDDVASTNESVQILASEPDNLAEIDKEEINIVRSSPKEIARLFRSISGLTFFQRRILELRYLSLIEDYQRRLFYIDILYHFSRSLVSVGSVAVPALLSIQSPTSQSSVSLFWSAWVVSLSVTICHNFSTLFRFDKKFFGLHSTLERLKSEGWQYLELTGNYSGHYGHVSPTHANQYVYFLNKVERLKLKQSQEEYNASNESDKNGHQASGSTASSQSTASTASSTSNVAPPIAPKEQIPSPLDLTINRGKKS